MQQPLCSTIRVYVVDLDSPLDYPELNAQSMSLEEGCADSLIESRAKKVLRRGQTMSSGTRGTRTNTTTNAMDEIQAAQTMYLRRHAIRAEDTTPRVLHDAVSSPVPTMDADNEV